MTVPDEVLNALPTGEAVSLAQLLDGARASAPAPVPKTISFGTPLRSQEGGEPGATGGSRNGPWEYTITRAERLDHLNGRVPKGYYVAVYATVTSFSRTSGVAGDGREVRIRDTAGRFHPPLYDVLYDARRPLGLPLPYDPIWPDQPFDTVWVYDLPPDATGLVLVLPLGAELELGLG